MFVKINTAASFLTRSSFWLINSLTFCLYSKSWARLPEFNLKLSNILFSLPILELNISDLKTLTLIVFAWVSLKSWKTLLPNISFIAGSLISTLIPFSKPTK